jgi:uncharacterized membrane protein
MNELDAWRDEGVLVTLRRRRGVRAGIVQGIAVISGLVLGLVLPTLDVEPFADAASVQALLVALGGGLVSFIALVYSLLFLVVQHANSAFSPRLTLFRHDPLVWRAFAVFVGLFVYVATAGLVVGHRDEVSVVVPTSAIGLSVVSLFLSRRLQMNALRLVQLNATLHEVRDRGEGVLHRLYAGAAGAPHVPAVDEATSPARQELRWGRHHGVLRQIDLPQLHRAAVEAGAVITLHVGVGEELTRRGLVISVQGDGARIDEDRLLGALEVGIDRTFEQDPLLALRLMNDIGARALSPAVNDPGTACAAIAHVHDLLATIVDRDLDVGRVHDHLGDVRVVLRMPTWEDFLVAGVDDIAHYGADTPLTRRRLIAMLDDLVEVAPIGRRPPLQARRDLLAAREPSPTTKPSEHPWSTT